MKELWRRIPDYPDYLVSSLGRIAGHRGLLKPFPLLNGYLRVNLYAGRKARQLSVSRLVLLAFKGPPGSGMEAAHLNGKRQDNRVSNLSWTCRQENEAHKIFHGTLYFGERHPRALINACLVRRIRKLSDHHCPKDISSTLGISVHIVKDVLRGRTWGHVR